MNNNPGVVARQTFEVGSPWPSWGQDVCLELVFHRRAFQEGFLPEYYAVPGTRPDVVFYYNCGGNPTSRSDDSNDGGCCSFHLRVEVLRVDAQPAPTTTSVDLDHNHDIQTITRARQKEAMEKIRKLEAEVRKEALLEIAKIKNSGWGQGFEVLVREMQNQVLEDVEIAAGRESMERVKEDALEAATLVLVGSEREEEAAQAGSSAGSRQSSRLSSLSDVTPPLVLSTTYLEAARSRRADTPNSRSEGTSTLSPIESRPSPPVPQTIADRQENSPSPSQSNPRSTSNAQVGSRSEGVLDTLDTQSHSIVSNSPSTRRSPRSETPFFETSTWSNLESFRSTLAASGLDYVQVSTGQDTSTTLQISFRCARTSCSSRFTVGRLESGEYSLQQARTNPRHDHSSESSLGPSPSESVPSTSSAKTTISLPSLKRNYEPDTREGPAKRIARSVSSSSTTHSGENRAKDNVDIDQEQPDDSDDDIIIVDVKDTKPRLINSKPLPEHSSVKQETQSTERTTPLTTQSKWEESPIPPSTGLFEYLKALGRSGGFDFSCYYATLCEGGIETVQNLQFSVQDEGWLQTMMDILRAQDQAEASGVAGGGAGGGTKVLFRETFRRLLTSKVARSREN
ncbi:hypothetical protein JCM16303_002046 [Sporobolomyces ruberrimus]